MHLSHKIIEYIFNIMVFYVIKKKLFYILLDNKFFSKFPL